MRSGVRRIVRLSGRSAFARQLALRVVSKQSNVDGMSLQECALGYGMFSI